MRMALPSDGDSILQLAAGCPIVGVLVGMHWRLQKENPRLPHLFYMLNGAVLKLTGRRVALCGKPKDVEELAAFLTLQEVEELVSVDVQLPGWQIAEENVVMVRAPRPVVPKELPAGFDKEPGAKEVLAVLESDAASTWAESAREGFLVDFMVRRNHGAAAVYGVWENAVLASTAGLYAIEPNEAYLACVETLPEHRRKGYASALVWQLCAGFGTRAMTLLCEEKQVDFYRRFGFVPTAMRGYVLCPPG